MKLDKANLTIVITDAERRFIRAWAKKERRSAYEQVLWLIEKQIGMSISKATHKWQVSGKFPEGKNND